MTLIDILVAIVLIGALWSGFRRGDSLIGRIVGAAVSACFALILVALIFYAYARHGSAWWGAETVRQSVLYEPLTAAVDALWKKLF